MINFSPHVWHFSVLLHSFCKMKRKKEQKEEEEEEEEEKKKKKEKKYKE